jgi:hypothetical protein
LRSGRDGNAEDQDSGFRHVEEGMMWCEQTAAGLRHSDDQPRTRPVAQRSTTARTLAQPATAAAAANVCATIGLIACLLLVWAIIVAT